MKFDYTAINTVTNEDFIKSNGENLKKYCEEASNYYSKGDLEKFCEKARDIIEIVLRYIYKRVTNKTYGPKMVGGIINDSDFVIKLNNAEIIRLADRINHISGKYNHAREEINYNDEQAVEIDRYRTDQIIPQDAKEIIDTLPQFLNTTIGYINTLKIDTSYEIHFSVTKRKDKETGKIKRILKAELSNSTSNMQYEFKWSIKDGEKINYHGSALYLKRAYIGRTIILKVVNRGTGSTLSGEYNVKPDDVIQDDRSEQVDGSGNTIGAENDSNATIPGMDREQEKKGGSKSGPLLKVSFIEAELAKELLKTQEDYDAED